MRAPHPTPPARRRARTAAAIAAAAAAVALPAGAHGAVMTFAGTGAGLAGDGGPATQARFTTPGALAVAHDGAVLVADTGNHRIRRVGPDGIVRTIAGTGEGFHGDGGPATEADLSAPEGVAVMPDGAILVADTGNHRVRRIAPDGTITTVAGSGAVGAGGDGGPATAAELSAPVAVTAAPGGGFLIADAGTGRVRRVDAGGMISTFAGTTPGWGGDGGPATAAQLNDPRGLTVLADGAVLIADRGNGRIRRVAPDGTITTVAGGGLQYAGDGGPASSTLLYGPSAALPLPNGGLLIADTASERIRRITPLGAVVTAAGGGRGLAGDGGPTAGARFRDPTALAWSAGGQLLVGDTGNHRVRLVTDLAPLPDPEPLRTSRVTPVRGSVAVRPRGRAALIPLREPDIAPNLSAVDARAGTIRLNVRKLDAAADAVADVSGGRFTLVQPAGEPHLADLRLTGTVRCATPARRANGKGAHQARRKAVTRRIKIKARGRFRTTGRYASAVANGTAWTITDRCDRTIIRVTQGSVTVRDQRRNRTVRVRAGRTYVALAKPARVR